ncbi:MAG: glycosyltransferase family 4 protein [Ignavibacteriae bacterium]|nr:glycosyltransferase family 4 protein [Ignavibacteriota bacterium]
MKSDITIAFISAFHTPFIQDDLEILEKHFHVRKLIGSGILHVFRIILGVLRSDVVFCWFASVYAFMGVVAGKVFGVKSIVIVGGVDAAKDKELDYGIWLSPWRAVLVRYVFRNAEKVLVVDPCLRDEAIRLASYDGNNIMYVPTGYDSNFWKFIGEKQPFVLTVAVVRDNRNILRKGIDLLIEAARQLQQIQFTVIGVEPNIVLPLRPPLNVTFHALMPRSDLLPFYQQAKVYCQPSRREGLPNSLCEAMLCGCIPVATNVSGNPTAIGDAGILISSGDIQALVSALQFAMTLDDSIATKARMRAVSLFSQQKRVNELLRLVKELTR